MDIRKRNRLVAAGTVAIVLLLVVLVAMDYYENLDNLFDLAIEQGIIGSKS